jgi:hypothetical protein
MNRIEVFPGLKPADHRRHGLHGDEAVWPEKNCSGDLWIELLNALGCEPLALLPFTLAVDFEGDQWTFFKPPQDELRDLYGIDVQELTVYRPLIDHAVEHLGAGKLIATETDAFWLPDTVGTDYRTGHKKTTIAMANLDVEARTLGYFHNAGYFELSGDDFAKVFHLDAPEDPAWLPFYADVVRIDRVVKRPADELAAMSMRLLRRHFDRRPQVNPFKRFAARLVQDVPMLKEQGLARYHLWAFASIRQAGAAFELAAANLRWLAGFGHEQLTQAAQQFESIAQANKALILKGARAANAGRALDAEGLVAEMAQAWEQGMQCIGECVERAETAAVA